MGFRNHFKIKLGDIMTFEERAILALERLATTQEKLLAIAEASQRERNELSDKMKQAFRIEGVKNEVK